MSADFPSAIRERVEASPLTFHESDPGTGATYPYVVAYFDGEPRSSDRECDSRVRRDHGFYTVVVGVSIAQTRAARARLMDALSDWAPTVTGRSVSKIENDGSQPAKPDPELPDRTLYIATDQWRAVSDPA